MDRDELETALADRFGGSEATRRAISRQARDLSESGKFGADLNCDLTPAFVVSNLQEAPEDHDLPERWNWWMGSLELSHGRYQRFQVRTDLDA